MLSLTLTLLLILHRPKCQTQSSKLIENSLVEKDGLFQIDF